ncbi:Hypp866 [Branchiostoma lanceolatum]|uniref:Hypp866 protein n=1 Tax=Branchiostoma lanceolatum TaxID=7740 RepID=A0A8J9YKL6_BRALA|nr:Hypp866 [Branchiostoma lanceolatum]
MNCRDTVSKNAATFVEKLTAVNAYAGPVSGWDQATTRSSVRSGTYGTERHGHTARRGSVETEGRDVARAQKYVLDTELKGPSGPNTRC